MLNYLRESLHWVHLTFFKPLSLEAENDRITRGQAIIRFVKVYPVAATLYLLLLMVVGKGAELAGYFFDWGKALCALVIGLFWGLVAGLFFGLFFGWAVKQLFELFFGQMSERSGWRAGGMGAGLSIGLVGGLGIGVVVGLGGGGGGGLFFGLVDGLAVILFFGRVVALFFGRVIGQYFGRFVGVIVGVTVGVVVEKEKVPSEALNYFLAFFPTFFIVYFRLFYLLPQALQLARARNAGDPFSLFHHSPVYWDEAIVVPLPGLKDWLVDLVKRDRERGMGEILFVAEKRPYQRKAAFRALLTVIDQDLQQVHDVKGLANAASMLKVFPVIDEALPTGIDDTRRRLNTISTLAHDYQSRLTSDGRLKVLEEMRSELETFRSAMALTAAPVGTIFQPLAVRWLELVNQTEAELRRQLTFTAIRNPYIAGNPLEQRDENIFVGRRDIIRAIESFILNTNLRPSLLLYGNRRAGKSSTLKNLPRLLSSQFEPVYMDCQDAKWHESDQAFCYNLAQEIFATLQQRETVRGIAQPQLEQFEKNAFTRLDQYLDQFEKLIQQRGKRLLLSFDEYEALEEIIANADISKNVLGKLRNIIQHRERIVVLVSGSHRFDELSGLNWASYLINTRTLELSFLDEAAARELLTQPVPKLQYESGVVDEIIRITHCQPYLLQAVASELVNYLNDQQRTTATMDDLAVTIEKVLVSAGSYFANTWTEGRSDEEQSVMLASAMGEAVDWATYPTALRNLLNAEIVEASGNEYQLTIDLFRRWILKHKAPVLQHGEHERPESS